MKLFTAFILSIFILLTSCSSSDTASTDSSSGAAGTGKVSLLVTDAPNLDFDQVNITIEEILFIGNNGQVSVYQGTRTINLLSLQNYSDLLTTSTIPAGSYEKIRLLVSKVELVRLNPDGSIAETELAKLPANGKIELNPRQSFVVAGDGHLMIELDIDATKSVHIIETGKGGYNFRPVIFINIFGEDEFKLVMLDGTVFNRVQSDTAAKFTLCSEGQVAVSDDCLLIDVTANTVVQDQDIDVTVFDMVGNGDDVTVLAKISSNRIEAFHVVLAGDEQETFSGDVTSSVDASSMFGILADENNLVPVNTAIDVLIANGARVFDEFGIVNDSIIVNGRHIDVYGLAQPDIATVSNVKAAFIIVENKEQSEKLSGEIVALNLADDEITVTVSTPSFSGDQCVNISSANIFQLSASASGIYSSEIIAAELLTGMSVDIYGDNRLPGCLLADAVLVTAP